MGYTLFLFKPFIYTSQWDVVLNQYFLSDNNNGRGIQWRGCVCSGHTNNNRVNKPHFNVAQTLQSLFCFQLKSVAIYFHLPPCYCFYIFHVFVVLFARSYVANRVTDKLTKVTDYIYCCRSGSAADTQAVADIVNYHLNFHKWETHFLKCILMITR